ncbi:MAG: helix-turn-helix domain-containing protein [Actinomycetota bacterium]
MTEERSLSASVLEPVGVAELEERVYIALLDRSRASLAEIATDAEISQKKARQVLSVLETRGLVSRAPGRDLIFTPAPPDIAVEALILERQEQLERTRLSASRLMHRFRVAAKTSSANEVVEVVRGLPSIRQRFVQLQQHARKEMLVFDRPPYVDTPGGNREVEVALMARGVRCRAIYDAEGLELPGRLEAAKQVIMAGEEAKALTGLPMKMALADRSLGLIPLRVEEPGLEGALLIYPSPLLEALAMLFDRLWAAAVAIPLLEGDTPSPFSDLGIDEDLIALLLAGLKPQAVARRLGLGLSTVERKVRTLMEHLGATTRFQAGYLLAQGGWTSRPDKDGASEHAAD